MALEVEIKQKLISPNDTLQIHFSLTGKIKRLGHQYRYKSQELLAVCPLTCNINLTMRTRGNLQMLSTTSKTGTET